MRRAHRVRTCATGYGAHEYFAYEIWFVGASQETRSRGRQGAPKECVVEISSADSTEISKPVLRERAKKIQRLLG